MFFHKIVSCLICHHIDATMDKRWTMNNYKFSYIFFIFMKKVKEYYSHESI